jgi:hypothetical protein
MAEVDRSVTVDPERHGRATERLWRALEALYSPEWEQILERLRVGEPGAIEPAVVFLETDARCHRSGYTKEQLCRYLRRMDLPDVARQRLRAITPAAVGDPRRPERERRAWRLLADSLDAG